jgi:hypothetical protein
VFAGPPWNWPPDVTLRQRARDLELILMAADYGRWSDAPADADLTDEEGW